MVVDGLLLIRTDGNEEIGSGHVIRCLAVAEEALTAGADVLFAVSDERSRALVATHGIPCEVVGGDCRRFYERDADALVALARQSGADAMLVDSYAVTDRFFLRLARANAPCIYIDDGYAYEYGYSSVPIKRELAAVVSYSFDSNPTAYEQVYSGADTKLYIGPQYAPIRARFRNSGYYIRQQVREVLITTGATNPGGALERMARGCSEALPTARLTVVVGGLAAFDDTCLHDASLQVLHDVADMASVMRNSDVAVSAAGSTLYELACMGTPTVAVPLVENQLGNAEGFEKLGVGICLPSVGWIPADIAQAVSRLADSTSLREAFSHEARSLVDGLGAKRVLAASSAVGRHRQEKRHEYHD